MMFPDEFTLEAPTTGAVRTRKAPATPPVLGPLFESDSIFGDGDGYEYPAGDAREEKAIDPMEANEATKPEWRRRLPINPEESEYERTLNECLRVAKRWIHSYAWSQDERLDSVLGDWETALLRHRQAVLA